jgi:hypothetical protein
VTVFVAEEPIPSGADTAAAAVKEILPLRILFQNGSIAPRQADSI